MCSHSSNQYDNLDDVDNFLEANPSLEDKNASALRFIKTYKLNSETYPLEKLLNSQVSPNLQDQEGKSLLMIAAEKGLLQLVDLLIRSRADIRLKDRLGKTALMYAIEANTENADVVTFLLSSGADPNTEVQDRMTPLLKAVEKNYYNIAKNLLERQANVKAAIESSGDTGLHLAAKRGNVKMINLLLKHGADPNKRNNNKLTLYDLCQTTGNPELFVFLQDLQSTQKANQSNVSKSGAGVPSSQQRPPGYEEGDEFINAMDKDQRQSQSPTGHRSNKEQSDESQDQRKQKNQKQFPDKDHSRKMKGRNDSAEGNNRHHYASPPSNVAFNNNFPNFENQASFHARRHEGGLLTSGHSETHLDPNRLSPRALHEDHFRNTSAPHSAGHIDTQSRREHPYRQQGSQNMMDREMLQPNLSEPMPFASPQSTGGFRGNMQGPQVTQNMQQNIYGQSASPQFFNNAGQGNNPNQAFPKKKNKNQNQQGNVKNFPNPAFNNAGPMNPMVSPNQNQFGKRGSVNAGIIEQTPPGPGNQMNPANNPNGKYNKNQNKGFPEKGMPRGHLSPNMNPNNPNMNMMSQDAMQGIPINVGQMSNEMQPNMMPMQHNMEHYQMQENIKKEGKMPLNTIVFNGNNPNMPMHQYGNSPHMFQDVRGMMNNLPPQNSYVLPHQQVQQINDPMAQIFKDQQSNRIMNTGMNPPMNQPQGNFGQQGINFNMQNNPNQMNQMMPKQQFMDVQGFNFQNQNVNMLDNSTMQTNNGVRTFHLDMNNQLQQKNFKLKADLLSVTKINKDTSQNLEKIRQENKELKAFLESKKQIEQKFKKSIQEKEDMIEELAKKTEDLEKYIKNQASRSQETRLESTYALTDPVLTNFQVSRMDFLLDTSQRLEFSKHDRVAEILHQEITSFEKSIDAFNHEKKPVFDLLIEHIKEAINEAITGAECEIYGSFATGLCLPWSDIDIVLKPPPQAAFGTMMLDSLEATLKKKKWVDDVKTIRNTTVPVLKITCGNTYLNKKVDITLYDSRHNGIPCVELVRDYLITYPSLRPMVLVLKQLLYRINLNDTYSGGLSSYGLILMVVFLFQTKELQRATEPIEKQSLGNMLLSFLQFYGFEYDYYTQFLVNPKRIPKLNDKGNDLLLDNYNLSVIFSQSMPSLIEPKIIIQDPMSSSNNVGRGTFQIKEIKNAFMAAYFEARKPCVCEIHKYIEEIDAPSGKTGEKKCSSIFKRMMMAYQPTK